MKITETAFQRKNGLISTFILLRLKCSLGYSIMSPAKIISSPFTFSLPFLRENPKNSHFSVNRKN